MRITAVKQQVKRADRYAIFVDEKYAFSLGELELINTGLKVGQEIDQKQLIELKNTAKLDKANDSVLNLISRRPRSVYEIQTYLKRKGYEILHISTIVEKCQKNGMLDDAKFTKSWVRSRRLLKNISQKKLRLELRQKGIAQDIIQQVLESDETTDQNVLKEIIAKKRRVARYQDDQKLMQYLAGQGFNYGDIKQAVKQPEP